MSFSCRARPVLTVILLLVGVHLAPAASEFAEVPTALPGVAHGAVAWGDYDQDGDLDVAIAGWIDPAGWVAGIFRNDGGGRFRDLGLGWVRVAGASLAWGDYDRDGDLDLLLAGQTGRSR